MSWKINLKIWKTLLKDQSNLFKAKNKNLDSAKTAVEIVCQVCRKICKTKKDLDSHIGKDHKIYSNPGKCSNCKHNVFMIKRKEYIARLQGISNDLVNEKKET